MQRIYTNFYGAAPKIVLGQQHPQIFTSLELGALLLGDGARKEAAAW
jgi:hypothetical protein